MGLLLRCRRVAGGPEIEPEVLPVVVYVIKDDDLAVAHQSHIARRRRVVVRRLIDLLGKDSLYLGILSDYDSILLLH